MKLHSLLIASLLALSPIVASATDVRSSSSSTSSAASSSNSSSTSGAISGSKSNAEGGSVGDIGVTQDGDKTDVGPMIAVAPPAFSYAPGAAVGEEVVTESYAVGFPLIGGGFGEQGSKLTPTGIMNLHGYAVFATGSREEFVARAILCVERPDLMKQLNQICEE